MIVGFNLHKIDFNVGDFVIARSDVSLPYCTICANHELIVIDKNTVKDKFSLKVTTTYTLKDTESDVYFPDMQGEYFSRKVNLKKAQYIHNANVDKIRLLTFIKRYCPKRRHVISEMNSSVTWEMCGQWEDCKPKEDCIFCVPKERFKRDDEDFIYMYIRMLKVRKLKKKIENGL
jgi:hypothetical protein